MQFPDCGTELWHLAVEMIPGEQCDFSIYLGKRVSAQSGEFAEVQLPDYGTELLSPGSRNYSRKALRFQHLSCQESESSVWSMRRSCSFLTMEQSCGPVSVEIFKGKHSNFSTYLAKRPRTQSFACAEVKFSDYGTVLWSPGSRNCSRNELRFQQQSCQESESSVWRMLRSAVS
jgi:hypothetical protein